jgi:hypothetical protein
MEPELQELLTSTASFKVGTSGAYGPSFTTAGPYACRIEYKTRVVTNMRGESVTSTVKVFFEPTDVTASSTILTSAKLGTLDIVLHGFGGDVQQKVHAYQIMLDEDGNDYAIEVYS